MASEFSNDFIEQTFYIWYECDRKTGSEFWNKMESLEGKKPSKTTLDDWIKKYGWIERADALDAEVSIQLDQKVIDKRIKMFERHEEIGNELIEKGMNFLKEKGISKDDSAIRAIDLGMETQRISTGVAENYAKISKMSSEQMLKELDKLLGGKKEDPDIIDGQITEQGKE